VTVRDGKYGPYINHGKINATLPRGMDPESVTLEAALPLLAAKAEKGPSKRPARKPRAKKSGKKKE
jgi:DNA topoisomerase-1